MSHPRGTLAWVDNSGEPMDSRVDRRSFLAALAGLPAVLAVGRDAPDSPRTAVEVDTFFVAGFQFHAGPSIQQSLKPGTLLAARRDPANPHDEWAIALLAHDVQIGYVPRRHNGIPARLLDGGFRVRFEVADVDPQAPAWERVLVRELVVR